MIINMVYGIGGLDKLGDIYRLQGFALAQEMALFDGNNHVQPARLRDASNFTAWCLFNIDSYYAWQFFREPLQDYAPKFELPDPLTHAIWYGEVWMRYPTNQSITPSYYGLFFRAISQLRVIVSEICAVAFGPNTQMTKGQASSCGSRLMGWYDRLPPALTPRLMVLPAHFYLQ
jgi:hypothetical protein